MTGRTGGTRVTQIQLLTEAALVCGPLAFTTDGYSYIDLIVPYCLVWNMSIVFFWDKGLKAPNTQHSGHMGVNNKLN